MQSILIENLSKRYNKSTKNALSDVSLSLDIGVFGLLGPNGAGKTTLMRILATLISPTSGKVRIHGHNVVFKPSKIRPLIGYLPQEFSLYSHLKAKEYLEYMGLLSNVPNLRRRIDEVLDYVGMLDQKNKRISTFSGGMRQRVAIAQALIHSPPILLVDEPTAGLDPAERVRFRNLISEMGKERTILLSTHIVEDVAATCKQIAILKEGRVVFWGDPPSLTKLADGKVWEAEISSEKWELFKETSSCYLISSRETIKPRIKHVRFLSTDDSKPDEANPVSPAIEDAYLSLIFKDGGTDETH